MELDTYKSFYHFLGCVYLGNFSSVKKTISQQREDGNLTNEVKRKKADKLAMREGEMCYEKNSG